LCSRSYSSPSLRAVYLVFITVGGDAPSRLSCDRLRVRRCHVFFLKLLQPEVVNSVLEGLEASNLFDPSPPLFFVKAWSLDARWVSRRCEVLAAPMQRVFPHSQNQTPTTPEELGTPLATFPPPVLCSFSVVVFLPIPPCIFWDSLLRPAQPAFRQDVTPCPHASGEPPPRPKRTFTVGSGNPSDSLDYAFTLMTPSTLGSVGPRYFRWSAVHLVAPLSDRSAGNQVSL